MIVAFTVIVVFLLICATVLGVVYMYYCNENEIGMFADPRYIEKIKELERQVKELKET